jgi:histidinol-phosphate aminotransferase
MCFASAGIIEVLNKIKPPYNINSNTIKLGLEVLKQTEHKEAFVSSLLAEREAMAAELKTFAVIEKVFPSDANFLLVRTTNAPALYDYLLSRNIVTRRRDSEPRCENCLRITVGTSEENQSLLSAIRDYQLGAN